MHLYTFHFCDEGGSSATFEAYELPDELAAFDKAEQLLGEHATCSYVEIWRGEQPIGAGQRRPPDRRESRPPESRQGI